MNRSILLRCLGALMFATIGVVSSPTATSAQQAMSPEAKKYLQQVINKMREYAIRRDEIEWKKLESDAVAAAPNAQTIADLMPAIKVVLNQISDKRAAYRSASGQLITADLLDCARPILGNPPQLPANIGYLRLVPEPAANVRVMGEIATRIQTEIKTADAAGATGWILDLRAFRQGSIPPAIMGIAPLLGDGVVFYTVDMYGNQTSYSAGENKISSDGAPVQLTIEKFSLIHKKPKVAVLVGPATGGVGETIAIAFTRRSDSRSFGTATCGMPPYVSRAIDLSDGAKIYANPAVIADRNHKRYYGPLEPDEKIESADQVIEAAIKWLTAGN